MKSSARNPLTKPHSIGALFLTLIAVLGTMLATAPAASAATTVRGTVMCISQESVVGVWIQAEKGGSGWATLTNRNNYQKSFKYTLPKGGRYQVHVGCGLKNKYWWGGGKIWKTNNQSGYVSGNKNFTCVDYKYATLPKQPQGQLHNGSFYKKCIVA